MKNKIFRAVLLAVVVVSLYFWVRYWPAGNDLVQDPTEIVKISNSRALGNYLTDGRGVTLYTPVGKCYGLCLENWTPYWADPEVIDSEDPLLKKINLVPWTRGDYQYSYGEQPLFFYIGDKNPGDANGNGHKFPEGHWTVIVNP